MSQPRISITNSPQDRITAGDKSVIIDESGTTTFGGNIVPAQNTYSVGTIDLPWKDVYISAGSLVIADTDPEIDAVNISNTARYIVIDKGGLKVTANDETHEIFQLDNTGKLILKSLQPLDPNSPALSVIGNLNGNLLPVTNPGMVKITGIENTPSRLYVDGVGYSSSLSQNAFPAFVGRAARGSVSSPQQLLNNDIISRFAGNSYSSGSGFGISGNAKIELIANENQTSTARGTRVDFILTPNGTTTETRAFSFDSLGIKFPNNSFQTRAFHGYSGAFYDTTTQGNTVINTPRPITFNNTISSDGVSIVSGSRMTIANAGTYNIQFSAQIEKNSASQSDIAIWLRKNGTDVVESGGLITLQGSNPKAVGGWNYVEQCNAGDYFELVWASSDAGMRMYHVNAQTSPFVMPSVPSVIATVTQVV
jgi:hypothetical protein